MPPRPQSIKERLATLETLNAAALRVEWGRVFGRPASPHLSREFLLRAVAYRIQEQAGGGLSSATRRRLMREWNGETHVVEAVADGFVWKDKRYRSLSAVARAITGVRWSGPRFFGLNGEGESKEGSSRPGNDGGEESP